MAIVYVASSKGLANWGADHGLTKHFYKIGVTDGTAEAAVEELNAGEHAGHTDRGVPPVRHRRPKRTLTSCPRR